MHTNVHCSTVYNSKDLEPTEVPIDDRLEKCGTYTPWSIMQPSNNEFMSFVGTWMNLENIILSKLAQEQKMKYIFSLIGW